MILGAVVQPPINLAEVERLAGRRRGLAHQRLLDEPAERQRLIGERLAAAEEEVGAARIAHRPAAGGLGELHQGAALLQWNDGLHQFRFGFHLVVIGECGVAAHGRP